MSRESCWRLEARGGEAARRGSESCVDIAEADLPVTCTTARARTRGVFLVLDIKLCSYDPVDGAVRLRASACDATRARRPGARAEPEVGVQESNELRKGAFCYRRECRVSVHVLFYRLHLGRRTKKKN